MGRPKIKPNRNRSRNNSAHKPRAQGAAPPEDPVESYRGDRDKPTRRRQRPRLKPTIRVVHDDDGEPHEYEIEPFMAGVGIVLETTLLGALTQGGGMMGALYILLEEEGVDFILKLLSTTLRDGEPIDKEDFDVIYAANYGEMKAATMAVIEANFGGLLRRIPFDMLGLTDAEDAEGMEHALSALKAFIDGSPQTSDPSLPSTTSPEDLDSTPST